jgi:AcrR family transcriptional regulator
MIHYYFGGKDGLMMALFMDFIRNHPNTRAEKIADACIAQRTIKPLVEQLAKFYNSRPNLSRMTMSEMIVGSSKIKALYNERYSQDTPAALEFVLKSMISAGIYNRKLNVKFVAMSLMGMVVVPMFVLPATQALEMSDKLDSPEWIDHIVQMIELSIGYSSN